MRSAAMLFVAQMQDWLELAEGCRMNLPGTLGGNWTWRMLPGEATPELAKRIRELTRIFARLPKEKEKEEKPEQAPKP